MESYVTSSEFDWNDPDAMETGESTVDAIHLSVGKALSAWEMLETSLAQLFTCFCSGARGEGVPGVSGRAYGWITGGSVRKRMLLEAAAMYGLMENRELDLAGFQQLLKHYEKASRSRNNIAHGVAMGCATDSGNKGFFLVPAPYLTKGNPRPDEWEHVVALNGGELYPWWKYRYTAENINFFVVQYQSLQDKLWAILGSELTWCANQAVSSRFGSMQVALGSHDPDSISAAAPAPQSGS